MDLRPRRSVSEREIWDILDGDVSDIEVSESDEEYIIENNRNEGTVSSSDSESESSDREQDEVYVISNPGRKKQEKYNVDWKKQPYIPNTIPFTGEVELQPDDVLFPIEYFRKFVSRDLLKCIATETNTYSVSVTGGSINTTRNELEQFIGVYFIMGLVQMPSVRAYWENETRHPPVVDIFSRNRFEKLLRLVHFVNNETATEAEKSNRLWKIYPFLTCLRTAFLKIIPEEHQSVDEIIVPFRGRSYLRQYLPNKPHRWGFKIWDQASKSGILHDFEVYQGKSNVTFDCGLGGHVVLELASTLQSDKGFKIFADNYFTSLDLLSKLDERGIKYTGTVRSNRLKGCPLTTDKAMKQSGRGTMDHMVERKRNLVAVKWFDNRAVTLLSSMTGIDPIGKAKRWDKSKKEHIEVDVPAVIKTYNEFMGGIDMLDSLTALYKYHIKSRRWYMYIFFHLLTVALINGWLLYRRHSKSIGILKHLNLRRFQAQVADSLIRSGKVCGRMAITPPQAKKPQKRQYKAPSKDIRTDKLDNWPKWCDKRQRCKYCKDGLSFVMCSKCVTHLCLNKDRNCFADYHR